MVTGTVDMVMVEVGLVDIVSWLVALWTFMDTWCSIVGEMLGDDDKCLDGNAEVFGSAMIGC